jgi:glycosyltransferase involved in cell wall biosynthesis
MKFSLVVPTVGRPADLQRFIDHLQLQACDELALRDLELIVVDQSGQPDTGELLARQTVEFSILHLPMQGRGASRARNFGWSFARGKFITFPDDDCHYPQGFLGRVLEKFHDPAVDAISTSVEHMSRPETPGGQITRGNVLECCLEAGLFARRQSLGDLRYDELMGVGCESPWNSDEGPDLLLRMMARGLRIDYCPDLVIHHPNPLQTLDERLQERNFKYSRGRGYLLRKHRFPLSQIAKTLIRSFGGSLLMAARMKPFWARYYWRSFVGKVIGLRGGKNAPEQLLTSPLTQQSRETVRT